MAEQLISGQQIVVGGQQVHAVLLAREEGLPQLTLSAQRPDDALTIRGRAPVDRSSWQLPRMPGPPRPEGGPSRRRNTRRRGAHRPCPERLAFRLGIRYWPLPIEGQAQCR